MGRRQQVREQIDCDPYEPGKSEIKRRYVQEHTFRGYRHDGHPSIQPVNQPPAQRSASGSS